MQFIMLHYTSSPFQMGLELEYTVTFHKYLLWFVIKGEGYSISLAVTHYTP